MTEQVEVTGDLDQQMKALVEGLIPLVTNYISNDWDWTPWFTVKPEVESGEYGPAALPPGYVSNSAWTITYEGAYGWGIDFPFLIHKEGPVKEYVDQHGLFVECWNGHSISLHRLLSS